MDAEREVPIPEVPTIAEAEILQHPVTGSDCLVATTEDGERVAFGFEIESESPGLVFVEPSLWLQQAEPEQSDIAFSAEHGVADDWLQAVVAHPVGFDWLTSIKHAHPAEYDRWFSQEEYEEGGEGGS